MGSISKALRYIRGGKPTARFDGKKVDIGSVEVADSFPLDTFVSFNTEDGDTFKISISYDSGAKKPVLYFDGVKMIKSFNHKHVDVDFHWTSIVLELRWMEPLGDSHLLAITYKKKLFR